MNDQEEWIVEDNESGDVIVDKYTGKFICRVGGNTIGECLDLATKIARLPTLEREFHELTRTAKELQSQVYYEQMRPYKIECEKSRLIEELEYYKERLRKHEDISNLF
jgi:hypothetical protein